VERIHAEIRPQLPFVDTAAPDALRPVARWHLADLEVFAAEQARRPKRYAAGPCASGALTRPARRGNVTAA